MDELKKALAGLGYTKQQANMIIETINCISGNSEAYEQLNAIVKEKRDAQEEIKALQEKMTAVTGILGGVAAPAVKKEKAKKPDLTPLEKQIQTGAVDGKPKKERAKKSETAEEIKDNVRSLGESVESGPTDESEVIDL